MRGRAVREAPAPRGGHSAMQSTALAPMARAFVDLHCHTRGSFDSLSNPADVMRAAARAG